jgi:hypothetical protein
MCHCCAACKGLTKSTAGIQAVLRRGNEVCRNNKLQSPNSKYLLELQIMKQPLPTTVATNVSRIGIAQTSLDLAVCSPLSIRGASASGHQTRPTAVLSYRTPSLCHRCRVCNRHHSSHIGMTCFLSHVGSNGDERHHQRCCLQWKLVRMFSIDAQQ